MNRGSDSRLVFIAIVLACAAAASAQPGAVGNLTAEIVDAVRPR